MKQNVFSATQNIVTSDRENNNWFWSESGMNSTDNTQLNQEENAQLAAIQEGGI